MVLRVVIYWTYGNILHYGLPMLKLQNIYGNASGNAFGNALKIWWGVALYPIHVEELGYVE